MKESIDLVIAGGGPAGLMAAIQAAETGLRVHIVEKNHQPGKKLLASGGGQCNVTHNQSVKAMGDAFHNRRNVAAKIIGRFPPASLMDWFTQRGVPLETREDGKVFPASRKASDVLKALVKAAKEAGADIVCDQAVIAVQQRVEGFRVTTTGGWVESRCLIIATGGASYPSLGTTGDGYQLAETLGHRVIPPRPALTGVVTKEKDLGDLAGVSLQMVSVSHWREGRKLGQWQGDLLFTHDGVSGPAVLNYARELEPGDQLMLNLAVPLTEETFAREVLNRVEAGSKKQVKAVLPTDGIPRRLVELALQRSKIQETQLCANLTKEQRKKLVHHVTALPLTVERVKGFQEAMVTAGGVAVEEVVTATLESRLIPRLFFAGEVLDVDGMTGGYNLQFAFSSGWVAGKGAANGFDRKKKGCAGGMV